MTNNVITAIKENLENYDWVKEHLALQMLPIKGNEEYLKYVPHTTLADLAVITMVEFGDCSIIVNKGVLKCFGVDEETLFADARVSSEKNKPLTIRSLFEFLYERGEIDGAVMSAYVPPVYICRTGDFNKIYGAAVLAYPSFIQSAFNEIGGSFYILPSSKHEVLLYKYDENISKEELRNTVCTINETETKEEDRLSDSIYYCDGTSIKKVA